MAKLKKRDDGRYQKNIIVGIKPNGKYIRKTLYGKTQKDLDFVNSKLSNEKFVSKAPADVVQAQRDAAAKYSEKIEMLRESIAKLG